MGDNGRDEPLPTPGAEFWPIQGGPKTYGELLQDLALTFSRESAPFATVFAVQLSLDAEGTATAFQRVVIPVTDHPETNGFHVRLEAHPINPADTEFRVFVNLEGPQGFPNIEAVTRDAGGVFLPGYIDDHPVMRSRIQPITVDVARVGGTAGELARFLIHVEEYRRVAFQPRSKGRRGPEPTQKAEALRVGKPRRESMAAEVAPGASRLVAGVRRQ